MFISNDIPNLIGLRPSIIASVEKNGYALLRGLYDECAIAEAAKTVYQYANSCERLPTAGVKPMDVRRNTSKWSIGGRTFQDGLPRFALTVYNPQFDADIFHLRASFDRLIQVRDILAGREILRDEALLPTRFNACRVQIYPAGGGFLGEHRDQRGVSNLPGGCFIEALLLLTQKGLDYRTGGGIIRVNGTAVDPEAGTRRGDIIVYDGSTIHGVLD